MEIESEMVPSMTGRGKAIRPLRLLPLSLALCGAPVFAFESIELAGGTSIDAAVTLNYTATQRLEKPASAYLNNPNQDDGTRNFKRGALVTNRLNALGELSIRHDNVGALLRGSTFYDAAYHGKNDNNSPATVNKGLPHNKFTHRAKKRSGGESRLLGNP